MDYWLNMATIDVDQLVPLARAAEELGFGGVALPDHLVFPAHVQSAYPYSKDGSMTWPSRSPWPDVWVAIAAMATATQRMMFATTVFVVPLRDPFTVAKAAGTAALLSKGRVVCGLGAGWMREEFDVLGVDFATRGARFDEMVEVLRLLWTGESVEYHGAHFDFPPIQMHPAPGQVPVIVGGNTAPARRRAVLADGWCGAHHDIEATAGYVADLTARRAAAGTLERPFRLVVTGSPRITRDADALADLGVDTVGVPLAALTDSSALSARVDAVAAFAATAGVRALPA
jgi:probable F420-dependent oxidoreductase